MKSHMERLFGPPGALLLVGAIMALFLFGWGTDREAPSRPAGTGFSGARALATLERLLAGVRAHPTGSPANAVVRDRILAEFRAAGYAPEVHSSFHCMTFARFPGCAAVDNIVAVRKGAGTGKAILATAHYDSVPDGPGAADDGAGVAVMLELARFLASRPPPRNDVIFLISDGEEAGLRGASAFAETDPLMPRVGFVVNLEARGDSGASVMFETGADNAALIALLRRAVAHPVSNSLAYEIYKHLPNDTDFTIYKKHGLSGYNFAFAGSASRYHTPLDDPAHLDRHSLQHQGDNAFAAVTRLADTDLATLKSDHDASYFDIFGKALVVWNAALNLPVAFVALAAILGLIAVHRRAFGLRAIGWSLLSFAAVPVLFYGLGWLLSFPLGVWPGVHPLDHPEPWPGRIALAAAAILGSQIAGVIGRRAGLRVLALVNGLALGGFGAAAAAIVPGAAYALIGPALVFALAGVVETLQRGRAHSTFAVTAFAGFVVTAFFWLGHMLALEVALSFEASQYRMLGLVPFGWALSPVFAGGMSAPPRRGWPAILLVAIVVGVAAFWASRATVHTPDRPRWLNIVYYDDRTHGAPRWLADSFGPPDEAFLKAAGFPAKDEAYRRAGLVAAKGRFKPATDLKLPAPSLAVTSIAVRDGGAVLSGVLRAGRGGFQVGIGVAPGSGLRSVRIDHQDVLTAEKLRGDQPALATLAGLDRRDAAVEIAFDPKKPARIVLFERSALPDVEEARALERLRPADSAPASSGDSALVTTELDLEPMASPPNGSTIGRSVAAEFPESGAHAR